MLRRPETKPERELSVEHSADITRAVMQLNTLEGEISRLYLKR